MADPCIYYGHEKEIIVDDDSGGKQNENKRILKSDEEAV